MTSWQVPFSRHGVAPALAVVIGLLAMPHAPADPPSAPTPKRRGEPAHHSDPRLTKPVTIAARSLAVDRLEADLAQQIGVGLHAEVRLGRCQLAIALHAEPASTVMDAVALGLAAEWVPVGDGYVLVTDP